MDKNLKRMGLLQKEILDVPDMEAAAYVLQRTENLFIATDKHADYLSTIHNNIKALEEVDFTLPTAELYQVWNKYNSNSLHHIWLRQFMKNNL